MKMRNRMSALLVATLLTWFACAAHSADDILLKAKAFLDANKPQAAYKLLAPLQSQRAGDPDYDYLLGVAALDLGKNTEAVFALERVLAVRPDNAPARAQIARAYFALKETDTARREFENGKQQQVPPEVRQTIERYLDAIRPCTGDREIQSPILRRVCTGLGQQRQQRDACRLGGRADFQ